MIQFGTKAETLLLLRGRIASARVNPLAVFSVSRWAQEHLEVLKEIQQTFRQTEKIIIRSSAAIEDNGNLSHAGEFLSIPNISPLSTKDLKQGIDKVISSYKVSSSKDQFFVQEQLLGVSLSGVLFTRDQNTLAPYYVLNFDDHSGSTTSVTSGSGRELKTYIRFRGCKHRPPAPFIQQLLNCSHELETIFENDKLDIEFAIDRNGLLYIFQVRPISRRTSSGNYSEEHFGKLLYKLELKMEKLSAPHPYLYGEQGMYSVMTDWNPAEMIGIRPKCLALSLYRELITDSIWAYQRGNYGYKDVRSCPLMVTFIGMPYIDVRASFSSFVPKGLDESLSHKLVNFYMKQLAERPSDHDKVEFNIVFSCYDLNIAQRVKVLLEHGFNELELDRIKYALLDLTNNIINARSGLYKGDLEKLAVLDRRFVAIQSADLPLIDRIYWLIEDCKRYGTLPFAGLARAGFVAVQMLRSLVALNIFTEDNFREFLNSLNTVARQLTNESEKVLRGELSQDVFLARYGHLRPGTYDILSKRYDEAFELYFGANGRVTETEDAQFAVSAEQTEAIEQALLNNGLRTSANELLRFIREGIEGREFGKFMFARNVSLILRYVEELGNRCGLTVEQMAHLDIRAIQDLYGNLASGDLKEIFQQNIDANSKELDIAHSIHLPQLIIEKSQITHFYLGEVEPNFITKRRVTEIIILENEILEVDITQKIVFIQSADPGYDWIFTRNIAGLVTMYGGVNSHMAIRCAELNIPAVIGCGEQNYRIWSDSSRLEIDCENRLVRVLT